MPDTDQRLNSGLRGQLLLDLLSYILLAVGQSLTVRLQTLLHTSQCSLKGALGQGEADLLSPKRPKVEHLHTQARV